MSTEYNYLLSVVDDVRHYIHEEVDLTEWRGRAEELEEHLNEVLWIADRVTGNASGSYTCSTWRAEEYLSHNWDLLAEALEEFGQSDTNPLKMGAEWCDVTIRCYLLGQAVAEAMEELADELEAEEEAG